MGRWPKPAAGKANEGAYITFYRFLEIPEIVIVYREQWDAMVAEITAGRAFMESLEVQNGEIHQDIGDEFSLFASARAALDAGLGEREIGEIGDLG